MTPADFQAWRHHMGYSQRAAAEALGVSLPTLQAWERGTAFATGKPVVIDKRTALACAAISAGLLAGLEDESCVPEAPHKLRKKMEPR